jgi:hypothetical protein
LFGSFYQILVVQTLAVCRFLPFLLGTYLRVAFDAAKEPSSAQPSLALRSTLLTPLGCDSSLLSHSLLSPPFWRRSCHARTNQIQTLGSTGIGATFNRAEIRLSSGYLQYRLANLHVFRCACADGLCWWPDDENGCNPPISWPLECP